MEYSSFPLIPILLLTACSAFFSATETSLFSLSRFQLRQLKQKNPAKFSRIRHLLDRPAALVATVLLGNEVTNMLVSNIMTNYYESLHLPALWITLINLVTVMPLILIFGEITPKVIAAKANLAVAQFLLSPAWWFYKITFPFRFVIETIVNVLTRGFRKKGSENSDSIGEEDFRYLLEEGKKKGAIQNLEQDIIENVFDIDDDKVLDLATPLNECFTVRQDSSPRSVIEKLRKDFAARIPVRGNELNSIVGILYAKDLLSHINREDDEMLVKDLMKEPLIIPANMKVEALFKRFRQMKVHIAIIEDKKGNHLAAITMEDILEHLFGELWEEEE